MRRPISDGPVRRLPAGALLLVLTISLVVAAILLSLIYLAANRRLLMQRDTLHQQVRRNLASGLAYAQAYPEQPAFQALNLDLFGEGSDSVQLMRKPWGVFDVAVVSAAKGHFRDTTVALLGSTFSAINQAALYLTDENVPLAVNDDAQVRGEAWLPQTGDVRSGSLPLTGERRQGAPVTGKILASQKQLPVVSDSALARLRDYAQLHLEGLLPAGSQPGTKPPSLATSFLGPPAVCYYTGPVALTGTIAGQVVVISSQRLIVEASSHLEDVLLLAPTILIKSGFRGRVQIIARDTVAIGDNCQLAYPSAACVYGAQQTALVSLGAGSRLQGVVIATAAQPGLACSVRLTPSTTVEGQVFSAGTVENCGTVRGTVMCRRLLYRGIGSFYENYLVNCLLDRPGLSPHFLTTRLLNPRAGIGVVAWLR